MANGNITVPVTHEEKPEKFSGANFKQWQNKILFYLTTLNLTKYLKDHPGPVEGETETAKQLREEKWVSDEFLCKNYLLGGLDNTIYNVLLGWCSECQSGPYLCLIHEYEHLIFP